MNSSLIWRILISPTEITLNQSHPQGLGNQFSLRKSFKKPKHREITLFVGKSQWRFFILKKLLHLSFMSLLHIELEFWYSVEFESMCSFLRQRLYALTSA